MSCEWDDERLHRWLDEDLTEAEKQELQAHMLSCHSCSAQVDGLQVAVDRLTEMQWLKAPTDFTANLMAEIDRIDPPRKNWRHWRVPIMRYTGVAAAALFVFGLGAMWATPDQFALEASNPKQLVMEGHKVIVPAGSVYNGDLTIQNGDLEVNGKVNGNVTALNGKVYVNRALGADISGETEEVDQAMEKVSYYLKKLWHGIEDLGQ